MDKPEAAARKEIDKKLGEAGWQVQRRQQANIHAARGVAVCEFPLQRGHGYAAYLLYLNGKVVGAIEAKKKGDTLTGVEVQIEKYSSGVPLDVPSHLRPLPFLYQSTGVESRFTNLLDPRPRSRPVFHFHKPETFVGWLEAVPKTDEQCAWLELIRDQVAASLSIELDDLEYTPFPQLGGTSRAYQTFGDDLLPLMNELNEVLAA
jgi:type I site-specific restriction endonuclease